MISHLSYKRCIAIMSCDQFKLDIDLLQKVHVPWGVLVVDEGHRAKNVSSKFRKALKEIKVRTKIILSGTPV